MVIFFSPTCDILSWKHSWESQMFKQTLLIVDSMWENSFSLKKPWIFALQGLFPGAIQASTEEPPNLASGGCMVAWVLKAEDGEEVWEPPAFRAHLPPTGFFSLWSSPLFIAGLEAPEFREFPDQIPLRINLFFLLLPFWGLRLGVYFCLGPCIWGLRYLVLLVLKASGFLHCQEF